MAITLDKAFWRRFAARTWERESLIVKNFDSPLRELDAAEVFRLLVAYADRCRKTKRADGFKFYIDGERVGEEHVLQLLPQRRDQSLEGYDKKMSRSFDDYCLVCDELLNVNHDKHAILARFTADLYAHVGFPNRFSEMGLYLGNYRKTPFGVHVDGCGVFSFPVAGQKTFRTWTNEFVAKNPALARTFKYEKFKRHSRLLTARVGDMTYWPSSAWHIAESDGSFSAAWSLGVWVDRPLRDIATEVLASLLRANLGADGERTVTPPQKFYQVDGEMTELPSPYMKLRLALQNLSTAEIEDTLDKAWMTHLSKQGFKTLPGASAKRIPARLRLRDQNSPILWRRSRRDETLIIGFGGQLVTAKNSESLLKLITELNSGKSCATKGRLTGASGRETRTCLLALAAAGAFA